MKTTHAQLIEDLVDVALYRWAPLSVGLRGRVRLRRVAQCFGNHALAQLEDSLDAAAEADAAGRFELLVLAVIDEGRARRRALTTAAVSG